MTPEKNPLIAPIPPLIIPLVPIERKFITFERTESQLIDMLLNFSSYSGYADSLTCSQLIRLLTAVGTCLIRSAIVFTSSGTTTKSTPAIIASIKISVSI